MATEEPKEVTERRQYVEKVQSEWRAEHPAAEDKLKELYDSDRVIDRERAKDIDLTANLVVERLRNNDTIN